MRPDRTAIRWTLATFSLATLVLVTDAAGHGGVYRGPPDVVPPATGGPSTGGPGPGSPTTPTPGNGGGPKTPGSTGGPQTPPGGGGTPGTPRSGPSTPGRKQPRTSHGTWEAWWEFNKDRFLDLRARLADVGATTGDAGFLTGQGRKVDHRSTNRPTEADIRDVIVPALLERLRDDDANIVDSAALALGRVARGGDLDRVRAGLRDVLSSDHASARQAAILALGILRSTDDVRVFADVMADRAAGRQALGLTGSVQPLTRALAAVALGEVHDPAAIDPLVDAVTRGANSEADLRGTAVLALGQLPEAAATVVPLLIDWLKDDRMERQVRAQVPVALGRLGAVASPALPELAALLVDKKTDNQLRNSVAIALGGIASPEDERAVSALTGYVRDGTLRESRELSRISLGRIAARAFVADPSSASAQAIVQDVLLRELVRPSSSVDLPYAGFALAIALRALEEGSPLQAMAAVKLHEAFLETSQPSERSALALAMGLARAKGELADDVMKAMVDEHDPGAAGYLAVALGLMGHAPAREPLMEMIVDRRDLTLPIQAATALGLLGDREALPRLIEALRDATTLGLTASLARSIGEIGDRSAIAPLVELAADRAAQGLARGFACVALGSIAERAEVPWNTPWIEDTNYLETTPALIEVASF